MKQGLLGTITGKYLNRDKNRVINIAKTMANALLSGEVEQHELIFYPGKSFPDR